MTRSKTAILAEVVARKAAPSAVSRKESRRLEYERNKARYVANAAAWAAKNREKSRAIKKRWRDNNLEKAREIESLSRAKYRRQSAARLKAYREANPGLFAAYCAKRRARKLQATPKWLTPEQHRQIIEIYELCAELQWLNDPTDPLTVDHIMPLRGKNSCGLHVPWNLQILPRSLNSRKSNNDET